MNPRADATIRVFATVEDLEERNGVSYGDEEQERISVLLEDASVMLVQRGFDPATDDPYLLAAAEQVVCNMVTRKISASDEFEGVSQTSMTGGPYSRSWTFANPGEAMYVTNRELETLGITRSRGRMIQAHTWADDAS